MVVTQHHVLYIYLHVYKTMDLWDSSHQCGSISTPHEVHAGGPISPVTHSHHDGVRWKRAVKEEAPFTSQIYFISGLTYMIM